jgi:superfamily II DNA or RNA helicase
MAELTVTVNSHNFTVTRITPRARAAVDSFARQYVQYGLVRNRNRLERAPLRVFAAATADRREYRFHINCLERFKEHLPLHYLKDDLVEWYENIIPLAAPVELPVLPNWTSHDYQIPVIEYLDAPPPPRSKFVDLQTGKGKSYCSLRSISNLKVWAVIIIKPMYLEKWLIDIRKTFEDLSIEDVVTVRGSESLQAILEMAKAGDMSSKIILISNKTMQNWIKQYEQHGEYTLELGYPCTPGEFCEVLGVGVRLIDEVHQDFHLNFKIDLYTNVERSVSLSATLLADDDFINKMYELAYPLSQRYKGPAYDKYIAAYSVLYTLQHPNRIRCINSVTKMYTHHLFEESILKFKETTANYLQMIETVLRKTYMHEYQPTQKAAVYCASIDMCTVVTDYLQKKFANMDVRRYVEQDPYDNLMDADIRVTTLLSAGTAVDIPNLTTVILTVAVSSSQSNIQGFGRLRKLKDGVIPQFLYLVCEDVPKHIEYHEKKRVLLEARALTYKSERIATPV